MVPVDRTTTAKDVRTQILANMDASVVEEAMKERIRQYVHWWLIAEVFCFLFFVFCFLFFCFCFCFFGALNIICPF